MKEILLKEKRTSVEYRLLAKDYKEKTGRAVCLSCPGDVRGMISKLKKIYIMSDFEFKRAYAQYRNKKGDRFTISNSSMTDEKAIEFLRTNPDRISLFSKYPKNWDELIIDDNIEVVTKEAVKDAEEAAKKLAAKNKANVLDAKGKSIDDKDLNDIEVDSEEVEPLNFEPLDGDAGDGNDLADALAEAGAETDVDKIPNATGSPIVGKVTEDVIDDSFLHEQAKDDDCCDDEHEGEPCEECKEKKRAELSGMKMTKLREAYPEIKATKKDDFIDKVLG